MNSFEIISVLEEKVEALLGYVRNLEEEKENLTKELQMKDSELSDLKTKIEALEDERAQVGSRVEQMLQKISSITGAAGADSQVEHASEVSEQGGFEFSD